MADLCLPLSAGEDTFELHSVQLELEAVGKEIGELLEKQAQLRKWKATLQISRADAHKIFPDVLHSGAGKTRTLGAAAEEAIQATVDDFSPFGLRDLHP